MPLKDDLDREVAEIFRSVWSNTNGSVVPDETRLALGNSGIKLDATVLYADLSASTKLVDNYDAAFAAEIYKAFLRCAARIIRSEGGTITAYDGDRVMAIFVGESKNTIAARTALKINWTCKNIIQPALKKQYANSVYVLKHTVGIDTSTLLAARAGIRGANDLVWIGRAANWAAKLTTLSDDYPTWITQAVYDRLATASKFGGGGTGQNMWEARVWTDMGNASIYRSTWWWSL